MIIYFTTDGNFVRFSIPNYKFSFVLLIKIIVAVSQLLLSIKPKQL